MAFRSGPRYDHLVNKLPGGTPSHRASLVLVILLLAFHPTSAYAYIDPGSGSLMLQLVMSGLFGALFLARKSIGNAGRMVRRLLLGRGIEETPGPPDAPNS